MKHLLSVSIAAVAVLGACGALFGKGPHVPSVYQGTTEITVANAGDREVCMFTLFQDSGPADNWLGDQGKTQSLAPGARRTFAIKAGVYHVVGAFCADGQVLGAVGTYGNATSTIEGPSLIALGAKHIDPVPGAKTLAFTRFYATPQAGGGDTAGEEPAAAEEPAASESTSSSSSSSSSSTSEVPSGPKCMAHGAAGCNDTEHCCPGVQCKSRTKFSDGSFGNGYCE